MTNYYWTTTLLPAHRAKPRDNTRVEKHISIIVYSCVIAALCNRVFYSLEDLNRAIRELFHQKNFSSNRKGAFLFAENGTSLIAVFGTYLFSKKFTLLFTVYKWRANSFNLAILVY